MLHNSFKTHASKVVTCNWKYIRIPNLQPAGQAWPVYMYIEIDVKDLRNQNLLPSERSSKWGEFEKSRAVIPYVYYLTRAYYLLNFCHFYLNKYLGYKYIYFEHISKPMQILHVQLTSCPTNMQRPAYKFKASRTRTGLRELVSCLLEPRFSTMKKKSI